MSSSSYSQPKQLNQQQTSFFSSTYHQLSPPPPSSSSSSSSPPLSPTQEDGKMAFSPTDDSEIDQQTIPFTISKYKALESKWCLGWRKVFVIIFGLLIAVVSLSIISFASLWLFYGTTSMGSTRLPIVINTWAFTNATATAFKTFSGTGMTSLDAVEKGCNFCEMNPEQCNFTVGYGGSPNNLGETTLDALIMWAPTRKLGSVGCLKRIKAAISVARKVMELTTHSLLVGEDATSFAKLVGFTDESLSTSYSQALYSQWISGNCTPNYWEDQKYAICPPTYTKRHSDGHSSSISADIPTVKMNLFGKRDQPHPYHL